MPSPAPLSLTIGPDAPCPARHSYRVAARPLTSDVALAALAPFAATGPASEAPGLVGLDPSSRVDDGRGAAAARGASDDGCGARAPRALLPLPARSAGLTPFTSDVEPTSRPAVETFRGHAWVGGRMATVACTAHGGTYAVAVEGLPGLEVSRGGCAVAASGRTAAPGGMLVEALLGPGLVLALALDDVFTLHAGAAAVDGAAVLLLGESGAGKSTLARALAAAPGGERLADDVLPVALAGARLEALPHYPQLKLPAAQQYPAARPERVAVRAVYALQGADESSSRVALEPLGARDAALALAAHTVAARLFAAPLLERHLAFCAAAAAAVPVRRLRFPRRLELLPELVAALRADLAAS